jgi:hypothetical protein
MKNLLLLSALSTAVLAACGGGGTSTVNPAAAPFPIESPLPMLLTPPAPSPAPAPVVAATRGTVGPEGLYIGTGHTTLVEPDGTFWALDGGDLSIVNGRITTNGTTYTGAGFELVRQSKVGISGTYTYQQYISETITYAGTFGIVAAGTVSSSIVLWPPDAEGDNSHTYDTPLVITAGQHAGINLRTGTSEYVTVRADGSFTGSGAGCNINGELTQTGKGYNTVQIYVECTGSNLEKHVFTGTGVVVPYELNNSAKYAVLARADGGVSVPWIAFTLN